MNDDPLFRKLVAAGARMEDVSDAYYGDLNAAYAVFRAIHGRGVMQRMVGIFSI